MARGNGGYPEGSWRPPRSGQLGAAEGTAGAEEGVVRGGGVQRGRLKGVPASYETGTATGGSRSSARNVLEPDNAAFASAVSGARPEEAAPPRGRLSPAESSGARLTVSPSMKTPTESPVPTQGAGYVVPSGEGRSGAFSEGAAEVRRY